jgi:hypothetical protein
VAHPDLVPVAAKSFDQVLQDKPHQKEILREDLHVEAQDPGGFQDRKRTASPKQARD